MESTTQEAARALLPAVLRHADDPRVLVARPAFGRVRAPPTRGCGAQPWDEEPHREPNATPTALVGRSGQGASLGGGAARARSLLLARRCGDLLPDTVLRTRVWGIERALLSDIGRFSPTGFPRCDAAARYATTATSGDGTRTPPRRRQRPAKHAQRRRHAATVRKNLLLFPKVVNCFSNTFLFNFLQKMRAASSSSSSSSDAPVGGAPSSSSSSSSPCAFFCEKLNKKVLENQFTTFGNKSKFFLTRCRIFPFCFSFFLSFSISPVFTLSFLFLSSVFYLFRFHLLGCFFYLFCFSSFGLLGFGPSATPAR